jgi:hypothetical protein
MLDYWLRSELANKLAAAPDQTVLAVAGTGGVVGDLPGGPPSLRDPPRSVEAVLEANLIAGQDTLFFPSQHTQGVREGGAFGVEYYCLNAH